ncbi:MAG: tetratricopeptide repeat protein [Thermomicrobiales bacterium]
MEEPRFGELLRRFRLAANLSQGELAARAGLSAYSISALERGYRRAPYRHTLDALARALGLGAADRVALLAAARKRRLGPADAAQAGSPSVATDAPARGPELEAPVQEPPDPAMHDAGLIGREGPFAEVGALLRYAGVRLLTITGLGGVGKTRLALALAHALAPGLPDGAVLVALSDLRDPGQVPAQIGRALDLPDRALDPTAALREHLAARRILLVLDNLEHLLPATPLVADLLDACPGLLVLATSRAPLHLARERVYELPPLSFPDPERAIAPAMLADYGAPALFVARARATRPEFTVTAANVATVAAICARLEGLPLAIELAAARLAVLAPADLLARLAVRLPLLTRGGRDLPDRQRTLRATLDWSHDLLNEEERALFRRLAAFSGGADRVALATVCGAHEATDVPGEGIDGLVRHGLVRREFAGAEGSPRYTMLETVREYAAEQLAAVGEVVALCRRHAGHFLALAEEAAPHLTGAEQARWGARLAVDQENLRAALRWAIDTGDAGTAHRLAAAIWRFWYQAGHFAEGRRWLGAVLGMGESEAIAPGVRATVLRAAGGLALMQADYAPARVHLRAALATAREAGDAAGAATALDYLALMAKDQADYHEALRLYEEVLAERRSIGDPRALAATLNNLGAAYDGLSDYRRSAVAFEESLALSRSTGDVNTLIVTLSNLGNALSQLGDLVRARALNEEALALARRLGERQHAAFALTNLGTIALDWGDTATALDYLREALALRRELGVRSNVALALSNLAEASRLAGEREAAAALLAESLALSEELDNGWNRGVALLHRGMLAQDAGAAGAVDDFRAALAQFRGTDTGWGMVSALNRLGGLTADPAEAAVCFRESLERCAAMGHQRLGAEAMEGLAAVALAEGDATRAARLLGAADGIRDRLAAPREPKWAERCTRIAEAARLALGEAAFVAAQATGRELDLLAAAAIAG